jgi:hypothetical protein
MTDYIYGKLDVCVEDVTKLTSTKINLIKQNSENTKNDLIVVNMNNTSNK